MKIPTQFRLNTDDYKIYFDNEKKTYVCEDIESGEKTNVGVIGTFLQMGILEPITEKNINPDERLAYLMDKVVSLEQKLGKASISEPKIEHPKQVEYSEEEEKRPRREPVLKKQPKTEEKTFEAKPKEEPSINQRVMEKILEKTIEEGNEEKSPKEKNINVESDEEVDNWMDI